MSEDSKVAVKFYEADVWGETLHPGETGLTKRIAELTRAERECRVLDVASGKGGSALFLYRKYGCQVIGVDLSSKMVNYAKTKAANEGLQDEVFFLVGEAEALPFLDHSFDVILCECSFSVFTDKGKVAREFWRVLRKGGRIAIADFYLKKQTPFFGSRVLFPCINGAEPEAAYRALLTGNGFHSVHFEDHTDKLKEFFFDTIFRFGSINTFLDKLPGLCSGACSNDSYREITRAFRNETLGYCIMAGTK